MSFGFRSQTTYDKIYIFGILPTPFVYFGSIIHIPFLEHLNILNEMEKEATIKYIHTYTYMPYKYMSLYYLF